MVTVVVSVVSSTARRRACGGEPHFFDAGKPHAGTHGEEWGGASNRPRNRPSSAKPSKQEAPCVNGAALAAREALTGLERLLERVQLGDVGEHGVLFRFHPSFVFLARKQKAGLG